MIKTTTIKFCGARASAYAERVRTWSPQTNDYSAERIAVRVYDPVAGYYVEPISITEGQRRYVIGRTLSRIADSMIF